MLTVSNPVDYLKFSVVKSKEKPLIGFGEHRRRIQFFNFCLCQYREALTFAHILTRKVKKDTANQGRYKPIAFYRLGMAGPTGRIAIYGGEIPGTP